MAIKQVSVFVENKAGKLADIVKTIGEANINIRALSIADTQEFGILRLIVSDTDKAKEVLSEDSIVSLTDVVAAKMDDKVGALESILLCLADAGIGIEYMYAFTATGNLGAYVVLRVNDNAAAEKALTDKGIAVLSEEEMKFL